MQAYLMGGPANGRVIPHPEMYLYVIHLPQPSSVWSLMEDCDPSLPPVIPIATYQFTGQATVNMKGEVGYMLYRFTGTDS
jgi:hypothetical protein